MSAIFVFDPILIRIVGCQASRMMPLISLYGTAIFTDCIYQKCRDLFGYNKLNLTSSLLKSDPEAFNKDISLKLHIYPFTVPTSIIKSEYFNSLTQRNMSPSFRRVEVISWKRTNTYISFKIYLLFRRNIDRLTTT